MKNLSSIAKGMSKEEVVAKVGLPDDIVERGEEPSYLSDEVFSYGTSAHLDCPTLGRVHFDDRGKVVRVSGARREPPGETLISETELRRLIPELARFDQHCRILPCGGLTFYDPRVAIHAANTLVRAGKRRAFAAIREACRVEVLGFDGLIVVRLICDAPPSDSIGNLGIGVAVPQVKDSAKEWPKWPVVYFSGVPFVPLAGYELIGMPSPPGNQIDYFEQQGSLRPEFKSTVQPSKLAREIDAFCTRLPEIFPDADAYRRGSVVLALRLQYLRLLSLPNLKAPQLEVAGGLQSESEWRSIKKQTEQYSLEWESASGEFVVRDFGK